jgi:hypothetical protein
MKLTESGPLDRAEPDAVAEIAMPQQQSISADQGGALRPPRADASARPQPW